MKRNDISDVADQIFFQNYENLFNVYQTETGEYYYNLLRKVNIPLEVSSRYASEYITSYGDTWTGLAYKFYNDVKLWWIICTANNIQNPVNFPEPGTKLNILNVEVVQSILSAIRDN